ncbi:MAG: 23S rRNA (pseudouridine(1915)-N(3))-methyltransferase RlmH [Patescibacteria group bacterium]|nr:23S rRNA (pseudouridine(1915)-N(3))-methyltransferase RlmH [Patescibacteria group bacterium]MBU2509224.1 23S rRNA (pseudouridine(1915)-N(3))-methyltransferase RlmH [Patescibacteria group bacterium]
MNKIIIRAIGRTVEPWQKQAANMYLNRLRPYFQTEIIELPEGHKGAAKPDIERTKNAEAESLLKGIPDDAFVVALDQVGKQSRSSDFATQISSWNEGGKTIIFLIGGSWGLSKDVEARANLNLSLSSMTLPHSLARIILLEQIYRAATIQTGKTYHK